jgi:hypothetical protein
MSFQFSYKITTESEWFTFDFTSVLLTGETVTTATCVATVLTGTDASPSAIVSGTPVTVGSKVSQRIIGGLDQVTYRLAMTIVTSGGNTYVAVGDLPVTSVASIV